MLKELVESSLTYFSAEVKKLKIKILGTFWGKGKGFRVS